MELYTRLGRDELRDRIAKSYFKIRDLDYNIKVLQKKFLFKTINTTENYLKLNKSIKLKLQELATMCAEIGLCTIGTPVKKLPFGYGKQPKDDNERFFFLAIPNEKEMKLMI